MFSYVWIWFVDKNMLRLHIAFAVYSVVLESAMPQLYTEYCSIVNLPAWPYPYSTRSRGG